MQTFLTPEGDYASLAAFLRGASVRRLLLVCGGSIRFLTELCAFLDALPDQGVEVVRFSDFQPNPDFRSVEAGVRLFREKGCDAILAVGGGSAMDVAKCIKLYAFCAPGEDWLAARPAPNGIPLAAMPTTAGSGSESTRFAVIYRDGVKQSVADMSILPAAVLLDSRALRSLPAYQRKATFLDALCHALESRWSVQSTPESEDLAEEAIRQCMRWMDGYLAGTPEGNAGMLQAANLAGQAIHITQTTAGHAMAYKLTTRYGCAHGHAVGLCMRRLLPWAVSHPERCSDPRGEAHLLGALDAIAAAMGCASPREAAERLETLFRLLELPVPAMEEGDLPLLTASVNPERLRNHPVALSPEDISALYSEILSE